MADSHPFANAGLGMFGSAEQKYAQKAMSPDPSKKAGLLGSFLASLIGLTPDDQQTDVPNAAVPNATVPNAGVPNPVAPNTMAQPNPNMVAPVLPVLPQLSTPPSNPYGNATSSTPQSQTPSSGYHPDNDRLWGNRGQ